MPSYISSWLPWGSSPTPAPPPPAAIPPPPPAPPVVSIPVPAAAATTPPAEPMSETKRVLRQVTLPVLGGAFLLLSVGLTRRSTAKRIKAMIPPYYHPNNQPPLNPPNGAFDAVEALQLATLNVFSVAMLMVGGGAFAMNVSTIDELREKFKVTDMGEEWEGQKQAAEEEFEEWVVSVLARKELKDKVKSDFENELAKQKMLQK